MKNAIVKAMAFFFAHCGSSFLIRQEIFSSAIKQMFMLP
jgi:hypothetical protein